MITERMQELAGVPVNEDSISDKFDKEFEKGSLNKYIEIENWGENIKKYVEKTLKDYPDREVKISPSDIGSAFYGRYTSSAMGKQDWLGNLTKKHKQYKEVQVEEPGSVHRRYKRGEDVITIGYLKKGSKPIMFWKYDMWNYTVYATKSDIEQLIRDLIDANINDKTRERLAAAADAYERRWTRSGSHRSPWS